MWARLEGLTLTGPAMLGAAAACAAGYIIWTGLRRRLVPEELERRRRIKLHLGGRMTEATVHQAEEGVLHYSYQIAGVAYETSQEIKGLMSLVPSSEAQLIGAATAKYDPQNPANSILVCEHWSGLRSLPKLDEKGI